MSSFYRTIAMSALVGATMLAGPLTAMAADSAAPAATRRRRWPPIENSEGNHRATDRQSSRIAGHNTR